MDSRQIKEVQGPSIAHPINEGFHVKKDKRIEEVITKGIVFTVSSLLDISSPTNARMIAELLHLANHDAIDIDLAPTSYVETPSKASGVGRIMLDEKEDHFMLTTTRKPHSWKGISKPVRYEMLADWFNLSSRQADALALEILAHRKLGNEVFITNDKKLIHNWTCPVSVDTST